MNQAQVKYGRPLQKTFGGISAGALRLLATAFMLSDHLWASIVPGNHWMTDLGRLAFPIYAYLISEGYIHTANVNRYLKRLLLFAVLSEIPFNLFYSGYWLDPFHQNVLFTFVWGLLAIVQADRLKENWQTGLPKKAAVSLLYIGLICLGAKFTFTDYGFLGFLTVVMFWLFRDFPFAWAAQLLAMVLLNWVWFKGEVTPVVLFGKEMEIPNQAYAVLALIPIWLYNGKKGQSGRKLVQYGFYAFYPAHMLILYFLQQLLT